MKIQQSLLAAFAVANFLIHPAASFGSLISVTFDEPQFSGAPAHFALVSTGGAFGPEIHVGGVTFNGGVVLNESAFAGEAATTSNLYATFNGHFLLQDGSSLPGIIAGTLASAATSISLDVFNGHSAANFTLTGFSAGNSIVASDTVFLTAFNSMAPAQNSSVGSLNIGGPSIAYFTVTSNQGAGLTDFAIDTVNITATPEPASIVMWGPGIVVGVFIAVRRRRYAAEASLG